MLLRNPPNLEEAAEVGAVARLAAVRIRRSGEDLPVVFAISVAVGERANPRRV